MDHLIEKYLQSTYKTAQVLKDTPKSKIVLATDTVSRQPCIIKYLNNTACPYAELEKLHHKNMPEIYRVISGEEQTIVIEEYISGQTLADMLIHKKHLSEKQITAILQQLCSVLALLHQHHFIHRDIKPSNIMMTNDNIVKLIDFDAARIIKDGETLDTEYLGTRGYAPPEQYGFSQTDIRSDIYALGITLKAMEPRSVKLRKIADKAARFDPARRYQNVREIQRDLKRLTPMQKAAIASAAFVLSAIAGLYGYSYYLNATDQPNQIEEIKDGIQQEIKQLPQDIKNLDTDKLKENIKQDIKQLTPPAKIEPTAPAQPPKPAETQIDDKTETEQKTLDKQKRQQQYDEAMQRLDNIQVSYSYDGTASTTLREKPKASGEQQTAEGTINITLVNDNDTTMPGGFAVIFQGMYIPPEAFTYSPQLDISETYNGQGFSFSDDIPAGGSINIQVDMDKVYPFNDNLAQLQIVRFGGGPDHSTTIFRRDFTWQAE